MRCVIISDTHGQHEKLTNIPDGDVLIHCGDCTEDGSPASFSQFINWFAARRHHWRIVIAGNHDWCMERNPGGVTIPFAVNYLMDSSCAPWGKRIWGSPVQPNFHDWAFNRARGDKIRAHWDMIPPDTEVLVTHGPPAGILDKTIDGESVGCRDLLEAVFETRPALHCFGHIHYSYGQYQTFDGEGDLVTTFVNAALCGENYELTRQPFIYDIK
jgi:predicted phosphodiesterase